MPSFAPFSTSGENDPIAWQRAIEKVGDTISAFADVSPENMLKLSPAEILHRLQYVETKLRRVQDLLVRIFAGE